MKKPASEIKVGDFLAGGTRVVAVCEHLGKVRVTVVREDGLRGHFLAAPAKLITMGN